MPILGVLKKNILKYVDLAYFLKFLFLFLVLYYGNIFYIAVIDPKGILYSPFLERYLNYIVWLRNSILYTSNSMLHAFGITSSVILPYKLKILHGAYVETIYECLGLGLMSFWIAFVSAEKGTWKKKIQWVFIGIVSIWIINCLRITLLIIALQYDRRIAVMDHHTFFNIFAYALIVLLIYYHTKIVKRREQSMFV